jgi:hypothetical protein
MPILKGTRGRNRAAHDRKGRCTLSFEFLNVEDALLLAQDALPKIAGRGRSAKPFSWDEYGNVLEVAEAIASQGGEACAPIVVGVPKSQAEDGTKSIDSELMGLRNRLANGAKGRGFHFVIRTQDEASTLYVVAGEAPERKPREATA